MKKLNSIVSNSAVFLASVLFTLLVMAWLSIVSIVSISLLETNDFSKFYYSSLLYYEGYSMYDISPATLVKISGALWKNLWNMNPPHFHFLLTPFSQTNLLDSYLIWIAINIFFLFVSIYILSKEVSISFAREHKLIMVLLLLSFSGTSTFLITGQYSYVLLFIFTLFWISARNNNHVYIGLFLGILISLKLIYLVYLPYLIIRRDYRALLFSSLTIFSIFTSGYLYFGQDHYLYWLDSMGLIDWSWISMNGSLHGFLTRVFSYTPLFKPLIAAPSIVLPSWIFLSLSISILTYVFIYFDSKEDVDLHIALLNVTALIISPLGWIYYLVTILGPLTIIVLRWTNNLRCLIKNNRYSINIIVFVLSCIGLFWQFHVCYIYGTIPLFAATNGSVYFWSFLLLWLSLALEIMRNFSTSRIKWLTYFYR